MTRLEIEGVGLECEVLGPEGAEAVVITPGGRFRRTPPAFRGGKVSAIALYWFNIPDWPK